MSALGVRGTACQREMSAFQRSDGINPPYEVEALVEGEMEAGYHEVTFDASRLPSGVYLYRLQGDNPIEVRKALLMK